RCQRVRIWLSKQPAGVCRRPQPSVAHKKTAARACRGGRSCHYGPSKPEASLDSLGGSSFVRSGVGIGGRIKRFVGGGICLVGSFIGFMCVISRIVIGTSRRNRICGGVVGGFATTNGEQSQAEHHQAHCKLLHQ